MRRNSHSFSFPWIPPKSLQRLQKIVERDLISGTDAQDVKGFGHFFGQCFIIDSSNLRELRTNCM
jgi:hypothetical protein